MLLYAIIAVLSSLLPVISSDNCTCGIETIKPRIINGKKSIAYTYPWVVYVERRTAFETASCTGSIISPHFVITAAHCVPDDVIANTISVYSWQGCGKHHLYDGPNSRVKKTHRHPKFAWKMGDGYDIALLELEKPITRGDGKDLMPICLTNRKDGFDYDESVVAGWGMIKGAWGKETADCLYETDIALTNPGWCKRLWPNANIDRVMCAGGYTGVCQGDSGGPLMSRHDGLMFQHGISSHTRGDCGIATKTPGVFERVYHLVDWIKEVTGNDGVCIK